MHRPRLWSMTSIALCVIACGSRETAVDCSPTPSCSLNDKRFAPASKADAGMPECEAHVSECRAKEVAAGGGHGCVRTASGDVLCWGFPQASSVALGGDTGGAQPPVARGQAGASETAAGDDAGNADVADVSPPPHDAVQIAAGGAHACARTRSGAVLCWGNGARGQVEGHANGGSLNQPVRVELDASTDIDAGGAHTCAVVARGVMCWGDARFGQSGREVGERALRPGLVSGTEDAVDVTTGVRHSCARLANGHVLCWGELIDDDGEARAHADPVEVGGIDDAIEIDAGAGHTCALRPHGVIACWGDNTAGQLGDGSRRASATPIVVAHLPQIVHVSAGGAEHDGVLLGHTCAVDTGFFVQCWGRNAEGQLGIGRAPDSTRPQIVKGRPDESDAPYLDDIVAISAGGMHSCALSHRGRVWCWGDDSTGQLGVDDDHVPPFGRVVRVHDVVRLGQQ